METKQFEEQNERDKAQLDEKKLLYDKIGELKKLMGPNASKKVMKEVRKAGEDSCGREEIEVYGNRFPRDYRCA
jgi:hypothetical protein